MANNQPAKVETTKEDSRSAIFTALREVLRIYQDDFVVKTDKPNHCSLETRSPSLNGWRMFFAAAKVKKNYVSYYLPPLYIFPELANRLSPELRRSLHGQSCFNFTAVDQNCLTELEKTDACRLSDPEGPGTVVKAVGLVKSNVLCPMPKFISEAAGLYPVE